MDIQELNKEFEINRSKLRSFVFRLTVDRADADDIVQDTYIRAAEKLGTFEGRSSLKTWIFSIAANLAKDHLRARKRWPVNAMDLGKRMTLSDPDRYMPQFFKAHASAHGEFEVREHIAFCFTCVGKTLPIDQRMVLLLKEFLEFKVKEIATILNTTESIVKHALFAGRKTMEEIFDQRCALVNKKGVCHQCSELNGIFNPKQSFQEEKIKVDLHHRIDIAKAADPFECKGRDLHFFHFEHIVNALNITTER